MAKSSNHSPSPLTLDGLTPEQTADEFCSEIAIQLRRKMTLLGVKRTLPNQFRGSRLHESVCLLTEWAKTGDGLTLETAEQNLLLVLEALYDRKANEVRHNYLCFGSPHPSGGNPTQSWEIVIAAAFARHSVLTTGIIGSKGLQVLTGKSNEEVERLHVRHWDRRGGRVNAFAPETIQGLLNELGIPGF